jgi:hypothetical protein
VLHVTTAVDVFQALAFLLCVAFAVLYPSWVKSWRRTPEGWYLLLSHSVFALVLGLGVVTIFAGPAWLAWAGRPIIRLVVYVVLCAVFMMPIGLLILRVRLRRRR